MPTGTGSDVSLRGPSIAISTPSLENVGQEPVPSEIFRDLLRQEWIVTEVAPRPRIETLNDLAFPGQQDLKQSDIITVRIEDASQKQRGFRYEFIDIEIPIVFDLFTVKDRLRLYALYAECRRIIYKWMFVLRPYQQLYWDSFVEESEGLHRIWQGSCRVRATSLAVPVFSGVTTGEETPNITPEITSGTESN